LEKKKRYKEARVVRFGGFFLHEKLFHPFRVSHSRRAATWGKEEERTREGGEEKKKTLGGVSIYLQQSEVSE